MPNTFTTWNITAFTQPHPGKNHDAHHVTPHALTLADGATPLHPSWTQDIHDFAQDACQEVNTQLHQTNNLKEAYRQAILNLANNYPPAGYKRTAGIATAHLHNGNITFTTLGDVTCHIQLYSNTIITVRDETLIYLDKTIPAGSALTKYIPNRKLANTPNGYPIFADNPDAANHLTLATFPADKIKTFTLSTDGMWHLYNHTPENFHTLAHHHGLQQAITETVTRSGYEFRDDATIIHATNPASLK